MAQDLLLAPHSGITTGRLGGPFNMLAIEPGLAACTYCIIMVAPCLSDLLQLFNQGLDFCRYCVPGTSVSVGLRAQAS